jgi:hypothetical protein
MEQNLRKLLMIGGAALIIILCGGAWWRILHRTSDATVTPTTSSGNTEQQAAVPTTTSPTETIPAAPVLHPDPPKLASHVLVGPKTGTKFYLAADSKRYVFPDDTKTYDTWKSQLPAINHVSQDELESYPLGGNVWYRPGTRLIKTEVDPNIYAVSHGGVLRAINEGTAAMIFGKDWKSLIDVLPDYYFTNYTVGAPILSPQEYSIAAQLGSSFTIEQDKGI